MLHLHKRQVGVDPPEGWVFAADVPEASGGLASAPLAMPAFFLGWVGLGVLIGLGLARRGHDRRTMLALGAGLGPLMFIVASNAVTRRERDAEPLVLSPGIDHGGDLDVLVLVQDRAEHVRSINPTLEAVEPEVGTLTLARVVDFEWTEAGPNHVIDAASSTLAAARDLVPIGGSRLVVVPGTAAAVARRFAARQGRTLVLRAIEEGGSALDRW